MAVPAAALTKRLRGRGSANLKPSTRIPAELSRSSTESHWPPVTSDTVTHDVRVRHRDHSRFGAWPGPLTDSGFRVKSVSESRPGFKLRPGRSGLVIASGHRDGATGTDSVAAAATPAACGQSQVSARQ
jgi:hypothetical protein